MTESEFIASIDFSFPYNSPPKWQRAVATGITLGPNAAFMVAHELCRPPRSGRVGIAKRLEIWRHLAKRFRHPLVTKLSNVIASQINGEEISVGAAIKAMRAVRQYKHQYNALAICYFSCNDRHGEADRLYEAIISEWQDV